MKKLYTPNHKVYEQYYVDQAKQKGGNLPAFHGSRFQQGYGLASIFKGLFRWVMPHVQQGAKVLGKKALQTGVQVAQDVLEGNNVNTARAKRSEEAISGPVPQARSGRKSTKKKSAISWFTTTQETQNSCVGSRPRRLSTLVVNLSGTPRQNYKILMLVIFNLFYDHVSSSKEQFTFLSSLNLLPRTSASVSSRESHSRTDTRVSSDSF